MGGLFSTLNNSLDALDAIQTALNVSQNNVSNSSTPGYASQVATFDAMPFDSNTGLLGGVQSGPTQSTSNEYANQAVYTQLEQQGNYSAQSTALASIQSLFDVTGQTGVTGAVNNLLSSFSAWSASPSDASVQQQVLASAQSFAQSFNSTANSLAQTTTQVNQQITSTVQQINTLAGTIAGINQQIQQNAAAGPDAGLSAQLESNLESLSQLTNISVTFGSNGTATVLAGGQSPLVLGNQSYALQASFTDPNPGPNADAVADAHILDSTGQDITSQISQGSLGGLLNVRNTVLPSLQGDSNQQGALNQLAQQVADRVNAVLTSATTPSNQPGVALFTYNAADPTDVAATLALNPAITAATLAPTDSSAENGAALELSNLGNSTAAADQINGQTIVQFAASIATNTGQAASDASTGNDLSSTLLSQAQALQTQISGVSLNNQAVEIMELQKGYEAASKMVSVIDSLTSTLINMVPST